MAFEPDLEHMTSGRPLIVDKARNIAMFYRTPWRRDVDDDGGRNVELRFPERTLITSVFDDDRLWGDERRSVRWIVRQVCISADDEWANRKEEIMAVLKEALEAFSTWRHERVGKVPSLRKPPYVTVDFRRIMWDLRYYPPLEPIILDEKKWRETWFEKLKTRADQGDPDSQFNLGHFYHADRFGNRNPEAAYFWLSLAIQLGRDDATAPRNDYAAKALSPEQIAAIEKRVNEWMPVVAPGSP